MAENQFKNGQVVKRPDAAVLNTKLRNLLNSYQEKLDKIENISIYDCKQLRQLLLNSTTAKEEDMIRSHMFPINLSVPKYAESWIVSMVDKCVATNEFAFKFRFKLKYAYNLFLLFVISIMKI